MKTFRPILAFTLITILLASCSTSNDVVGGVFQKRKYNKGFYWNRNSKLPHDKGSDVAQNYKSEEDKGSEIRFDNTVSTLDKKPLEIHQEHTQPLGYTKPVMSAGAQELTVNQQNSEVVTTEENTQTMDKPAEIRKTNRQTFSELKQKTEQTTSRNGDAQTDIAIILLVILAIIIPPLAVILYEGATGRFIIVLIIWLLALFGFFLYPVAGLLYLIAMIYALLIVLGVV